VAVGKLPTEKLVAHDGKNEEEHPDDQEHVGNGGQRPAQGRDHQLQFSVRNIKTARVISVRTVKIAGNISGRNIKRVRTVSAKHIKTVRTISARNVKAVRTFMLFACEITRRARNARIARMAFFSQKHQNSKTEVSTKTAKQQERFQKEVERFQYE
jgi:hypothetical protein